MEPHLARLDDVDRRLGQLVHSTEPLQRDQRLDASTRALTEANRVPVRRLIAQRTTLAQVLDGALVSLVGRQPLPLGHQVGQLAIETDRRERLEAMILADLEVDWVVARRDLERTRTELDLDALVRNDRDLATDHRDNRELAKHRRVARIVGMHCDRDVGENRDGTHRGDRDLATALDRIGDLIKRVVDILVLDLKVRNRCGERDAPVDEVVVAIDVATAVQLDEDVLHGQRVVVVHRKALARVVHRGAEALVLLDDRGAGRLFPRPDALDKGVASKVVARLAFRGETALDDHLRGDARVVCACLPEDVAALHATPANQQVLHSTIERVAHVQRARHIRRRQGDAVRLAGSTRVGRKDVGLSPTREDPPLNFGGLVARALF